MHLTKQKQVKKAKRAKNKKKKMNILRAHRRQANSPKRKQENKKES